ncbi:hypothetical protein G6F57_021757 [Rhizopus arrhizus]|nr:hypothetical protein G6F22_020004 [Rhizopus arrhizus]KAG1434084.1 hypothetical protein G6F57_021757 [Rhizopus arrhizus]
MSPTSFEAGLRRDLAVARVLEPVGQSSRAPAEVVASLETALTQQRTVQLRRFAAADYRSQVSVTPADIQAWCNTWCWTRLPPPKASRSRTKTWLRITSRTRTASASPNAAAPATS